MEEKNAQKRRFYTAKEKEHLLKAFEASGQSSKAWSQENKIALSTLQRWRQAKSSKKEMTVIPRFVTVTPLEEQAQNPVMIHSGIFCIEVSASTDKKLLVDVLTAVKSIC